MDKAPINPTNPAESQKMDNGQTTNVLAENHINHTQIKNDPPAHSQEPTWNSMDYVYGP